MRVTAALIVAGSGIASSIMGSSAAKKQAAAEAENRRRSALANYQMTMQKADVEEQMQIQGIFTQSQAAIAQEKANNKIAMANYKYAVHREKLAVMQKNFNASLGKGGKGIPAGLADELADQQMQILMEQEQAQETLNSSFNKALNAFSGTVSKRKLNPYSMSVMRYKAASYNDYDKAYIRNNISTKHKLRAAERAMKRKIRAAGGSGRGPMSKYIPGRKPTLFDSSKTIQANAQAQIANIQTMSDLIRSNAEIAKKAEVQNIATGYQAAKNAATSQMYAGVAGAIAGGVMAYSQAGGRFGGTNTPPLTSGIDFPNYGGSTPQFPGDGTAFT